MSRCACIGVAVTARREDQLGDQELRKGADRVNLETPLDGQSPKKFVAAAGGHRVKDPVCELRTVVQYQGLERAAAILPANVGCRRQWGRFEVLAGWGSRYSQSGEQENVNVCVGQVLKALQRQFFEGTQKGLREKVIQAIGRELGSDIPEDQRRNQKWLCRFSF